MSKIDVIKDIVPGSKVKFSTDYGKRIMHIVTVVENQIVYKVYSKVKQDWYYHIEPIEIFESYNKADLLELVK